MSQRIRTFLIHAGSFVLAGVLLYLALRGADLSQIGDALRTADYRWLVPLVIVALLSHLVRAWRWRLLLRALPNVEESQKLSLKTAFFSIMIGYMVNYAAPRLGEIARTANSANEENLSFSGVFGTVAVERVLDMMVLLIGLLSVFLLYIEEFATLYDLFIQPAQEQIGDLPLLGIAVLIIGVSTLFVFISYAALQHDKVQDVWRDYIRPPLQTFRDGLLSVLRSRRPIAIVLSTVAIWICYWIMAYLPLLMIDIAAPEALGWSAAWALLMLGSLGIVVPAPGGVGSYHYITVQTMVYLFAVPAAPAATYAVITHGAQLVLYVMVGLICFLLQGANWSTISQRQKSRQSN